MSDELFTPLFVPDAVAEAVSDRAWLQAMLDFEAALARAEAKAGVIPSDAANAIAAACVADHFDLHALGRAARDPGNPVPPLVHALVEQVQGDATRYVHWGATSQDVLDTASMLICRSALEVLLADLAATASSCARLVREHRDTPMVGRTLLQHALPTTFGAKAAGWLVSVLDGRRLLLESKAGLAVEFGGAAGTLASLEDRGLEVLGYLAADLDLVEPVVPWHAARGQIARIGAALGIAAGTMAKIALDVALMSQTEVAEVSEPGGARGGSSTMPHKRNPVGSSLAIACARRAQAAVGVLIGGLAQEHERAAGAWHVEWETLRDALSLTGGAIAWMRDVLGGLDVHRGRMESNLAMTGGLLLAERVSMRLAERIGRVEAHHLVESLCKRATAEQRPLRDLLVADTTVAEALSPTQIDEALDPATYVGAAEGFADRALRFYEDTSD